METHDRWIGVPSRGTVHREPSANSPRTDKRYRLQKFEKTIARDLVIRARDEHGRSRHERDLPGTMYVAVIVPK